MKSPNLGRREFLFQFAPAFLYFLGLTFCLLPSIANANTQAAGGGNSGPKMTYAKWVKKLIEIPKGEEEVVRWVKRDWSCPGCLAEGKNYDGVFGMGGLEPKFCPAEAIFDPQGSGCQTAPEKQKVFLANGFSYLSFSTKTFHMGDTGKFTCPGDSLMTGMLSFWQLTKEGYRSRIDKFFDKKLPPHTDRTMQYRCQFLEDGLGRPVRKQNNCVWSRAAGPLHGDLFAACPKGTYFSGHQMAWKRNTRSSRSDHGDYEHSFQCCGIEVAGVPGKKLHFMKNEKGHRICEQDEQWVRNRTLKFNNFLQEVVYDSHGAETTSSSEAQTYCQAGEQTCRLPVNFNCMNDSLLSSVRSYFVEEIGSGLSSEHFQPTGDRVWQFDCCKVAREGYVFKEPKE